VAWNRTRLGHSSREWGISTHHAALRLSAALLLLGELLSLLGGIFHPSRENPKDHRAVFAKYAQSAHWTAIHLGQFVGMAIIIAELLVIFVALNINASGPGWMNRSGAVSAVVALALYGVLQAVDGVALKQAVDAWVNAPAAEQVARLASAETIRWLEWGARSYHSFLLGLALMLFGTAIVGTARAPRLLGSLMALSGVLYIVQGVVLRSQGISGTTTVPQLLAYLLILT
jgi:hypothetical protein